MFNIFMMVLIDLIRISTSTYDASYTTRIEHFNYLCSGCLIGNICLDEWGWCYKCYWVGTFYLRYGHFQKNTQQIFWIKKVV